VNWLQALWLALRAKFERPPAGSDPFEDDRRRDQEKRDQEPWR